MKRKKPPDMKKSFEALSRLLIEVVRVRDELKLEGIWWRGQPETGLLLKPKIFRDYYSRSEADLIFNFVQQAPMRYTASKWPTESYNQLLLMQHYGLPTRLLDWSQGFHIALYFAVNEDRQDKPASLWALNPYKLNHVNTTKSGIFRPEENEIQEIVNKAFKLPDSHRGDRVIAMSGQEHDLRMLVQWSVFTIHESETEMEKLPSKDEFLREIVIPAEDRIPLRQALKTMGILRSRLFPDLQSLAESLIEAYQTK